MKGKTPPNRKHSPEQIRHWQDQVLAGLLYQADLTRNLGVTKQRVSALLNSVGGKEYRQLKRLGVLVRQRKTVLEISNAMGISPDDVLRLARRLYLRRQAGYKSSEGG